MRIPKLVFLFSFIVFLSFAPKVFASTVIDSDITENTIWTQNQSPYIVSVPITIASGITLSIEPGVVVKFNYGVSLFVNGVVNALGTEVEPIYFTSFYDDEVGGNTDDEEFCFDDIDAEGNVLGQICETYDPSDPFTGDWDGFNFSSSVNSNFKNVFFRYTDDTLTFQSSSVNFENLNLNNGISGLVGSNGSHVEVLGGTFDNIEDEAFTFFNDSSLVFKDVALSNIFNNPITIFNNSSFTGTNLTIDSIFANYPDTVVLFNNSDLSIKDSSFKNCPRSACITFFDGGDPFYLTNPSSVNIENTIFDGGFGSGLLTFGNSDINANIENSSFHKFDFYAIENYANFTVNAENNFWGDASGPYDEILNPEGLGEFIYGNVSFQPWLNVYPPPVGCTVDCFSNVLFLPGVEASRLYKQKTILGLPVEDQLWEPNGNSDVEDLYLNTDGTSINLDIYTRDIIDKGQGIKNIYKSFSETMDGLVAAQKINDWEPYAYDWRQSVEDIVSNGTKYESNIKSLTDTLQSLVASSKNGKVTIIAHSNGGLLAKALLKRLQDDKTAGINNLIDSVDVLILVGVPEIGTAKAVPSILHGYGQQMGLGFLVDESRARELGRNMLSAYGLLPSREYINRVGASPATFVDTFIPSGVTTKMVQTFGSAISSYDEYKDFLFGSEGRINPAISQTNLPISLSQSLFSQAENLHNSIDAWTPPSSLRVIEVAGWGLETVASFEYYPLCGNSTSLGCNFILDERPRFTSDGDGTVVVPSAQYMSVDGNAEKYWLNLFTIKNKEHSDILEVDSLLDFISNTIQNLSYNSVYLSTTAPIDTSNRLRLSIHSPVTIDAYDADGNHTGKICPPTSDFCYLEENILNSSYLEFGEGKYLNLPEDEAKSIKLQGIDIGTFTYESEKVLPNGTSTVSSFFDIPVTTQTQAEITLNQITGTPQLALDVTGDGVTDFTLAPSATFDPITYLKIMKATIDSLDISKDKIKSFDSKIENIIKSIQKGKINKAKLKIEQFKKALIIHPKENDKERKERERKNEKEYEKEHKENKKPEKLSSADAQLLLDMLNKLLDNLS